jgi:hypothetical protein
MKMVPVESQMMILVMPPGHLTALDFGSVPALLVKCQDYYFWQ